MRTNVTMSLEANRVGAKKETSTSKTRKRIPSKKNFIQKGTWQEPDGSKPHSKGERVSEWRGRDKDNQGVEINKRERKTTHVKYTVMKTIHYRMCD